MANIPTPRPWETGQSLTDGNLNYIATGPNAACVVGSAELLKQDIGEPGILPTKVGGGGYGICTSNELPPINLVCVDDQSALNAALQSNTWVYPNYNGWYDGQLALNGITNFRIIGQAAPGQGVGWHRIGVSGSNQSVFIFENGCEGITIEHIRALGGEGPDANVDPLRTSGNNPVSKLIFKNCHLWCGRDQLASVSGGAEDIIFYRVLWGPSCADLNSAEGTEASRGPLIRDFASGVLLNQNLFAGVRQRQPLVKDDAIATMANSVIAGSVEQFITQSTSDGQLNVMHCVYHSGPSTNLGRSYVYVASGGQAYLLNNCTLEGGFDPNVDQTDLIHFNGGTESGSLLGDDPCVELIPHGQVAGNVYDNVGVRPANRDAKQADCVSRSMAGTMDRDQSPTTLADLPTLAGGPSRLDKTRADLTSAEFRQFCGMADTDNALTIRDDNGVLLIEHFHHWLGEQS